MRERRFVCVWDCTLELSRCFRFCYVLTNSICKVSSKNGRLEFVICTVLKYIYIYNTILHLGGCCGSSDECSSNKFKYDIIICFIHFLPTPFSVRSCEQGKIRKGKLENSDGVFVCSSCSLFSFYPVTLASVASDKLVCGQKNINKSSR